MATFFENLRQVLPKAESKINTRGKILTGDDYIAAFDFVTRGRANKAADERDMIKYQQNETEPLREEIKQASGGKITVDKSIYNETALNRILNTVKKMKNYDNGELFPGYTVITNVDSSDDPDSQGKFYSGYRANQFGFSTLPSWGLNGTKNNPYKITLTDANNVTKNEYTDRNSAKKGWSPNVGEEGTTTQTHELSHSAHREALKKSHPPTLSMSPEENEAYQRLTNKYSSFRDLVEKLTEEYHLGNTKNAAASVSGYAESSHDKDIANKKFPFAEMFAEAYTDVLHNGDSARPFSKSLVKAYADYLNEYNAIFDSEVNRVRKQFDNRNNFINNLRSSTPRFGNSQYIIK